jgi:hypothetical protein
MLLVTAILGGGVVAAQTGGGYDLTWSTIDGGGGGSAGGGSGYQSIGTVGQSDAGITLSGGIYSLSGGFWGGVSIGSKIFLPVIRR